jgi:hypothetical protein
MNTDNSIPVSSSRGEYVKQENRGDPQPFLGRPEHKTPIDTKRPAGVISHIGGYGGLHPDSISTGNITMARRNCFRR